MDVVYVVRDGENEELRYSLRTLQNVNHGKVWAFGGSPRWLNTDTVEHRRRAQNASPYMNTRSHIAAACNTPEVSDPFLLWNDDFFAMHEVGDVPVMHRGSLRSLIEQFANVKTVWVRGMREAQETLISRGFPDALSYDLHAPLLVHKAEMREALRWASRAQTHAVHVRTFYGNLANLGGVETPDPKVMRRSGPFPEGPWLSSSDETFRSTVEPVLRYLFPHPSIYERK